MLRRRLGGVLALLLFTPIFVLMMVASPDLSGEEVLVEKMADLRIRLHHAEMVNQDRLQDVMFLSKKFNVLSRSDNNQSSSLISALSPETKELLNNMTSSSDLHLPSIYNYLPHLIKHPHAIAPAFKLSKGRQSVSMVLGVPTVRRQVQSYLMTTLQNLINSMTLQDLDNCLIVVMVAEWDLSYVNLIASQVEKTFPEHVENGLLEVISPPEEFYPDLNNLRQTLGDPPERVRWRTKQNLDFAFLMMYAQPKGTFYVQLEDDVQTKKGFITTMKKFALQKTSEKKNWFVLDFCQLGFIGKMFKCVELPYLVQFFVMFYNDKPVDWLLEYLIQTKICNMEKDHKHCKKAKENVWIRFKPSLFQHIGTHSSLKGKVQKLKDKQFGKVQLYFPHSNPKAIVTTEIKAYKSYTLQRAYKGESYFWGLLPQPGDTLQFEFEPPMHLQGFLFRSGNVEHPSDRLYNTTVEVLPVGHVQPNKFIVVGHFNELGIAKGDISNKLGKIKKLKLNVHIESDNWAILSEIYIRVDDPR